MAASISFLQQTIDSTDLTTYTFAAQSLGSANAGRYIVVGIYGRAVDGGARTISSVTIGGESATQNAFKVGAGSGGSFSAVYCAFVPTGTTGDVVVTWSSGMTACEIVVWRGLNFASATAYAKIENNSDPTVGTINCEAGGVIVGHATNDIDPVEHAVWTGITKDCVLSTYNSQSGASLAFASVQTNLSVGCDWDSESRQALAVASFSPSAVVVPKGGIMAFFK